jgi:hypothetical protein
MRVKVFERGVGVLVLRCDCHASSVLGSVLKQAPRRLYASASASCAPPSTVKLAGSPVLPFSSSAQSTKSAKPPSPLASSLKDKLVGAVAGGVLVALAITVAAYPALKSRCVTDLQSLAVANIQQSRIPESSVELVARPALQLAVEDAMKTPNEMFIQLCTEQRVLASQR